MALTYTQKQQLVSELKTAAQDAQSVIISHYHGVSVSDLTSLRRQGMEQKVQFQVARNNLIRIAFKDTPYEAICDYLKGPVMLTFSNGEASDGARLLKNAVKEIDALQVVAFGFAGMAFVGTELERLASMPTREEALGSLAYVLKAPITNFARDLKEVPGKFVRVLAAVKDQK